MSLSRKQSRLSLEAGHRPARNVVSRSGGIPRGKFPSRKNRRMVGYEQLLEADVLTLFEFSPAIAAFREQPRHIYFGDEGKIRRCTPDFEIVLSDGSDRSILVEIKPSAQLQKDEVRTKLIDIHAHLCREGELFVILTEGEIRMQPRLGNLKQLRAFLPPFQLGRDQIHRALRMLENPGTRTFGESASLVGADTIVTLLASGYAQFDLNESLTLDTLINFSKEIRRDWFFLNERCGF